MGGELNATSPKRRMPKVQELLTWRLERTVGRQAKRMKRLYGYRSFHLVPVIMLTAEDYGRTDDLCFKC